METKNLPPMHWVTYFCYALSRLCKKNVHRIVSLQTEIFLLKFEKCYSRALRWVVLSYLHPFHGVSQSHLELSKFASIIIILNRTLVCLLLQWKNKCIAEAKAHFSIARGTVWAFMVPTTRNSRFNIVGFIFLISFCIYSFSVFRIIISLY